VIEGTLHMAVGIHSYKYNCVPPAEAVDLIPVSWQ
jgi:hypothetical protein